MKQISYTSGYKVVLTLNISIAMSCKLLISNVGKSRVSVTARMFPKI